MEVGAGIRGRLTNTLPDRTGRLVVGYIERTEAMYLADRHGDDRSQYFHRFAPKFVSPDLWTPATERRA